ncbi:MAG TPA: Ig-like domain-containing protein [Longimicrobiales bacterium]
MTQTLCGSVLLAFVSIGSVACDDHDLPIGPPGGPVGVAAIRISPGAVTLHALGDSAQLAAVALDSAGNEIAGVAISWTNTDAGVATVNAAGWVVARSDGTAAAVASAGSVADTVSVTVAQVTAAVEVSPSAVSIAEGDTVRLVAVATDSNGVAIEDAAVEWEIEDDAVATVDASGLVTAVREGEAVVTARARGLTRTATITVLGKIAFISDRTGTRRIHVMNADGSGIAQLTDADLRGTFAWSPDGGRIAFAKLDGDVVDVYTVAADGSGLTRITNDPYRNMDPVWSPDGSQIAVVNDTSTRFGIIPYGEIHVVAANGSGQSVAITRLEDGAFDREPAWSPDGTRIAFRRASGNRWDIYVKAANGSGEAVNLTEGMEGRSSQPVWSPDATRIAFHNYTRPGGTGEDLDIYVIAADGSGEARNVTNNVLANDLWPAWSPDGSRIAFYSFRNGEPDIYVVDVDSGDIVGLTDTPTVADAFPSWSPDGTKITFSSFREGNNWDIYVMNADGSGETRLTSHEARDFPSRWRPRP